MAVDTSLQDHFLAKRASIDEARRKVTGRRGSGGSDEPPNPPNQLSDRIRELEKGAKSIETNLAIVLEKLDHVARSVDLERIRTDIANVSGKLDLKASAIDVAELKGRVLRIPTVPTLVGLGVLLTMAAGLARWYFAYFHL